MDKEAVVEKIVRSLSFEVVTVPHELQQGDSTSKITPLNVKIRVKKKNDLSILYGVSSISRIEKKENPANRIRLVSSDQTIMSFNVDMEGNGLKQNLNMLLPASTYKPTLTEDGAVTQPEGMTKHKFTLSKKDENTSPTFLKKNKDIFGKCKPGGCLDPPFGEDKYSYKPAKENPALPVQDDTNKSRTSSFFKNNLFKKKKKSNQDDDLCENDTNKNKKLDSVLNLFKTGSLPDSATHSTSIITYPPTTNSSEQQIQEDRPAKNRYSSEDRSSVGSYFVVPKKTRNSLEQSRDRRKSDKENIVGDYCINNKNDINGTNADKNILQSSESPPKFIENSNFIPSFVPVPVIIPTGNQSSHKHDQINDNLNTNVEKGPDAVIIPEGPNISKIKTFGGSEDTPEPFKEETVINKRLQENPKIEDNITIFKDDIKEIEPLIATKNQTMVEKLSEPNIFKTIPQIDNSKAKIAHEGLTTDSQDVITISSRNDQFKDTDIVVSSEDPKNYIDEVKDNFDHNVYSQITKPSKSSVDIATDSYYEMLKLTSENATQEEDNRELEHKKDHIKTETEISIDTPNHKSSDTDTILHLKTEIECMQTIYKNAAHPFKSDVDVVNDNIFSKNSENFSTDIVQNESTTKIPDEIIAQIEIEALEVSKLDSSLYANINQIVSETKVEAVDVSIIENTDDRKSYPTISLMDHLEKILSSSNSSGEDIKFYNENNTIDSNTIDKISDKYSNQRIDTVADNLTSRNDDTKKTNKNDKKIVENYSNQALPNKFITQNQISKEHLVDKKDNILFDTNDTLDDIESRRGSNDELAFKDLKDRNTKGEPFLAEENKVITPSNKELKNNLQNGLDNSIDFQSNIALPQMSLDKIQTQYFSLDAIEEKQIKQPKEIENSVEKTAEDDKCINDEILSNIPVATSKHSNSTVPLKIDLALKSYIDQNNERVVKSFDSEIIPEQNVKDILIITKCYLENELNKIKIPIDNENELCIQINNNRSRSLPDLCDNTEETESHHKKKITLDVPYTSGSDLENINDGCIVNNSEANKHNKMISEDIIRDSLISVYEQELVPLQNIIKGLREEIDTLTAHQVMSRDSSNRRAIRGERMKPVRLVHNRKCTCGRRL